MTQITWRTGLAGNWFVSANWIPSTVPATGDTAIIESGVVTISSSTPSGPSIVGEAIVLGGADDGSPAILHAINTVFTGTAPGPTEINATLTVTGAPAQTDAVFIVEGNSSFDGQIFVEAIAGSLTILVQSDGDGPGLFSILNLDDKAAIVVSQESFLDFEGEHVFNQGLIQIEGGVEISAGVSFIGGGGAFLLENGGQLIVEGSIANTQQVIFIDGTGKLTIENIEDFHAVIQYAEIQTPPGMPEQGVAGGQINLTEIEAQSFAFVAGANNIGTLKLYAGTTPTGTPIAELTMRMVTASLEKADLTLSTDDFSLSSNGDGGTLITYAPNGSTYLLASMPAPLIAPAGTVVSLVSLMEDSFGKSATPFKGVWLFPSKAFENTATNVGYWEDTDITPTWYINGEEVTEPTFVTNINQVTLLVGNQINNPASFQVRVTDDTSGPDSVFVTYDIWSVDPAVIEAMNDILESEGITPGSPPTPDMIVAAAKAFAEVYGDGDIPNTNLCNWIADNVAAAAGAPMPPLNTSLDPSLNREGGFWRIVYASDIPDPVDDWSSLVQPGDIVRMGWFKPESGRISGHSTTVLGIVNDNGELQVYDNNDNGYIGIHEITYWTHTDAEDITIYRLDPDQQYLIEGTGVAEKIWGSVYDNLIRPGGGADIVDAKFGDTEIEGTAAELNGISVPHFNSGDSFHFTDIIADETYALYRGGKLQVFEDSEKIASIKLPKADAGYWFEVTPDEDGGTNIELVRDDFANGLSDTVTPIGRLVPFVEKSGTINGSGDQDWFRVDLVKGATYRFTLSGEEGGGGTLDDARLRLYDKFGNIIARDVGSDADAEITFVATQTGKFYVSASGAGIEDTGTYTLTATSAMPSIEVTGNGLPILDGDTTPRITDGTSFGTVDRGETVIHTFTVINNGDGILTTAKLKLPKGFTLVEGLSPTIGAGESDTFQIKLNTNTAGLKTGTLSFTTNDVGETKFDFSLSGNVTGSSASEPDPWAGLIGQFTSPFFQAEPDNAPFLFWHDLWVV